MGSRTVLTVRGDRCFRGASNTSTVDGLTWLTLINISKTSDENHSGSRGENMPLHQAFVSAVFLLMYCSLWFSLTHRCGVHEPTGECA